MGRGRLTSRLTIRLTNELPAKAAKALLPATRQERRSYSPARIAAMVMPMVKPALPVWVTHTESLSSSLHFMRVLSK